MSFPEVLKRGEDFLAEYPRRSWWWNYASHAICLTTILGSKMFLNLLYTPTVHNVDKLDAAGRVTVAELVSLVYDDVDTSLHKMARLSLAAHLIKLRQEGRVREFAQDDTWALTQP